MQETIWEQVQVSSDGTWARMWHVAWTRDKEGRQPSMPKGSESGVLDHCECHWLNDEGQGPRDFSGWQVMAHSRLA